VAGYRRRSRRRRRSSCAGVGNRARAARTGPLGLGRAYVEGSLETDDIDGAFLIVDDWVPPRIGARDGARLLAALALAAIPAGIPRRPTTELLLPGERHSPERDAEAIRYHYDVGNEFFRAVPRSIDDLQLRAVLARRADARGGAARQARPDRPESSS